MSGWTWAWLCLGVGAAALEVAALVVNHRGTLSQTIQRNTRRFGIAAVLAWGAFSAWFAIHLWG